MRAKPAQIAMLPITHRRLKIMAAKMDLTLGQTVTYLLDQVAPLPVEAQIELMREERIE